MNIVSHLLVTIFASLGVSFLIRAWLIGDLFSEIRSFIEDGQLKKIVRKQFFADKLQTLLLCPLCLSPYVSFMWLLAIHLTLQGTVGPEILFQTFASATIAVAIQKHL